MRSAWHRRHGPHREWHGRHGGRFVRRAATAFLVVLVLSAIGAWTVLSAVLRGVGLGRLGGVLGLIVLAGLALAAAITAFSLAVRRLAVPIGHIIEASERVSHGDFSARLQAQGPRSLRSVARAFNAMTASLEENAQRRQQFMADISHELRTPLAILQGRLEGIADGVYLPTEEQMQVLLGETRTLARLVEDLRLLANAEQGALGLRIEPVDLSLLLRETAAGFDGQSGVVVRVDVEGSIPVVVDPVRIREAISNLIANAVHASSPGATVTLRASATSTQATVAVTDRGAGIAATQLPHIFERFYKGAQSTGTGLGLAIVRSIVEAHGGTITAESTAGVGTTMRFTLPVL